MVRLNEWFGRDDRPRLSLRGSGGSGCPDEAASLDQVPVDGGAFDGGAFDGGALGSARVMASETAAAARPSQSSLLALLAGHVLPESELIILLLKPSPWYIVLSSLRFTAVVAICAMAAVLYDEKVPGHVTTYVNVAVLAVVVRLMWATLQWMGRYYVLTDVRLLSLSGVFRVDVYDCPLRRIARTRVLVTLKDRLFRVGSIEIIPSADELPIGLWQTVARPHWVNDQIQSAISRTRSPMRSFDCP